MDGSRARVLIVDNELGIRKVYSLVFQSFGCETTCADDGDTGLAEFLKEKFDLVLIDLKMPRVDGIKLTKEIRARNQNIPILILTGYGNERQNEAYAAGCNEFLFKPIAMKLFKEKLEKYSPLHN